MADVSKALNIVRNIRQMMERSRDLPSEQRMMVVHKTRLPALQTYDRLGALPVPSTAVVKTGEPLTNFGDVTLVGNPEILAKPSDKNPIFASDVYSPRMPDIRGEPNLGKLVRNMRGNVRGGEEFSGTEGAVRAQITPQFRSVAELDAARERLSQSAYDEALALMSGRGNELFARMSELSRNPREMDFYGDMEGAARIMRQYGNQGAEPLAAYMTKRYDMNNDAMADVVRYVRDLRDMPAPYFEGKPQRAVPFTDFSGALIPEGRTARDTADLLNRQGVKNIEFYSPKQDLGGGEQERALSDALIERFPQQQFADGGAAVEGEGFADGGKIVRKALEAVRKLNPLGFYSKAAEEAAKLPQAKGTGEQMRSMLLKQGAKPEELKWTGFDDWVKGKKSVTRDEVTEFLRRNEVQLVEKRLGKKAGLSDDEFARNYDTLYDDYVAELGSPPRHDGLLRDWANARNSSETAETAPKFEQYTLPGGENYRETLLTAPGFREPLVRNKYADRMAELEAQIAKNQVEILDLYKSGADDNRFAALRDETRDLARELGGLQGRMSVELKDAPRFISPHWNEPDLLAHMRWVDRTDSEGRRVLHLEESQSEWGQAGRKKGFVQAPGQLPQGWSTHQNSRGDWYVIDNNNTQVGVYGNTEADAIRSATTRSGQLGGVPSGPFVESTPGWTNLVLKRALIKAARGNYDAIAWTPGAEQAKRYDLSQHIGELEWSPDTNRLVAYGHNGEAVINRTATPDELSGLVGKEVAERLVATPQTISGNEARHTLSGLDLDVGGKGMVGYYGKIFPTQIGKVLKDIGETPQFGTVNVPTPTRDARYHRLDDAELMAELRQNGDPPQSMTLPSFNIPPEMREKINQGLPLFTMMPAAVGLGATASQMQDGQNPAVEGEGFADGGKIVRKALEAVRGLPRAVGLEEFMPAAGERRLPRAVGLEEFMRGAGERRLPSTPSIEEFMPPAGERRLPDAVGLEEFMPAAREPRLPEAVGLEEFMPIDRADEAMRAGREEGGMVEDQGFDKGGAVKKALKAVADLFKTPEMSRWRGKSVIPSASVEDRYFHGTSKDKDFDRFNVGRHGVWLTKDPKEASQYAIENDSMGYKMGPGWNYEKTNTASRVIPVFARAENPHTGPIPDFALAQNYKRAQSDWFDQLRSQGHDAWLPENNPDLAVILRDPEQIKSAISNTGDFTGPRIDREDGGMVEDQGFNKGGSVVKKAIELSRRVMGYSDPPSKKIDDWKWRPLPDVATELDVQKIPPHVQQFGDYMLEMAEKAKRGEISDRDLIKAYTTTRASIQRRSQDTDKIREASGLPLVGAEDKIRPEGAWSEWLMSPAGQRYLDKAVKGEMPEDTVESALSLMRSFGLAPTQINAMDWAAKNLPGRGQAASDLVYRASQKASPASEWRDFTSDVAGVGSAKSGFLASLLGRGDLPTLDARQVILNTGLPTEASQKVMARSYQGQKGFGAQEGVDRLAARQEALGLDAPSKYDPFYQHLTHHTIWDKASNEQTTHADIVNAMRNAAIVLGVPAAGAATMPEEQPIERADGGRLLEDQYPTQYLPDVGRQVMQDGGAPQDYISDQARRRATVASIQPDAPAPEPAEYNKYEHLNALVNANSGPDADIRQYERSMRAIAQQPEDVRSMTHAPSIPMRDVPKVGSGFIGEWGSGKAPYDVADKLSAVGTALDLAYGMKTLPLYFSPLAPFAAASDLAEAGIDTKRALDKGDYVGAGLTGALGVALPAAAYRKQIGNALSTARDVLGRVPAPIAAAGAGAAAMTPEEAQAGKLDAAVRAARRAVGNVETFRGSDLIAKDPRAAVVPLSNRTPSGDVDFGQAINNSSYTFSPKGDLQPWREFDPQQAVKEKAIIAGILGDRSAAGSIVYDINGVKLTDPVDRFGGGEFQRSTEGPEVWASRPTAVKNMFTRINKGMKELGASSDTPVLAAQVLMGMPAIDSTQMMAKAILRQIEPTRSQINPETAKAFDLAIRKAYPDWPGILSPVDAEEFLATKEVGKRTSTILQQLDKMKAQEGGLPNLGATRFAMMEPRLVSADQGATGFAVSRLDPRGITNAAAHDTYPTGMLGPSQSSADYMGGTRYQVPLSVMFPDWWKNVKPTYVEKKSGLIKAASPTNIQQSVMTQVPLQRASQEWLDNLMSYMEANPKKWGYRRGGSVSHRAMMIAKELASSPRETTNP